MSAAASEPRDAAGGAERLPDRLALSVEDGGLTLEEALAIAEKMQDAVEVRERAGYFDGKLSERLSLEVVGHANEGSVEECRAGTFRSTEGTEADALYCNAILKIAAGELESTGRTAEGLPIWNYSEGELRALHR